MLDANLEERYLNTLHNELIYLEETQDNYMDLLHLQLEGAAINDIYAKLEVFFHDIERSLRENEVGLTDYLVQKSEDSKRTVYQEKKIAIKNKLLYLQDRNIASVDVYDYSKDMDDFLKNSREIYRIAQRAIHGIIQKSYTKKESIDRDYMAYEKEFKKITKQMKNDYKDHKRSTYMSIDTALRILEDPRYSKTHLVDMYSDLSKELKTWYQFSKETKEEADMDIKRVKMHYVMFMIRDIETVISKWIIFFTKHQVIELV